MLYEGRTAYGIAESNISNYFEGFREDFESACYGMYFLEVMDYFTRENNDEKEMLKLLYQSLRALLHPGLPVRKEPYLPSTVYAVDYIVGSGIEKLYTFTVTEQVLSELGEIAENYRKRFVDKKMKSLEILGEIPC